MPPDSHLASREDYIKTLPPVQICSAASPCPICQEEFDTEHPPVLLPSCGHIFGRPCILEWFEEGANTCPMDRQELFKSPKDVVEDNPMDPENLSLVPFSAHSVPAEQRRAATRRTRGSSHYLFFGGEIIGVNGQLTREGCRRVVRDLWQHSGFFFQQTRNDLDVRFVDEGLLGGPIHDALPIGISTPDNAWPVLIGIVRAMLVFLQLAWEGGWAEAQLRREEADRYAEELWAVCRRDDGY